MNRARRCDICAVIAALIGLVALIFTVGGFPGAAPYAEISLIAAIVFFIKADRAYRKER